MASYKMHHALAAHRIGQRAARRMALQSATVPLGQLEETCQRESEVLGVSISLAADQFALPDGLARSRFEAAVGKALDKETDRIFSLIARGTPSAQ